MKKKKLTHVNEKGEARMVDVSGKIDSDRLAVAAAKVLISEELLIQLKENTLSKGDAFAAARIAGIQAAKQTADLIPLCHPLPITYISVDLKLVENPPSVEKTSEVRIHYKTGVEMEALTAVSVAALTIYDMCKAVDKGIVIESLKLLKKSGGQSGDWTGL